jgi:hypothetical protein
LSGQYHCKKQCKNNCKIIYLELSWHYMPIFCNTNCIQISKLNASVNLFKFEKGAPNTNSQVKNTAIQYLLQSLKAQKWGLLIGYLSALALAGLFFK